jgi:hypothetical protein
MYPLVDRGGRPTPPFAEWLRDISKRAGGAGDVDLVGGTFANNGLIARTGQGAYNTRSLLAGTAISVANGDGVSGNPVISLDATASQVRFSDPLALIGATNVQDAIDALKTLIDDLTAADVDYDNSSSGLTATDAQAAIDEVAAASGASPPGWFVVSVVTISDDASVDFTDLDPDLSYEVEIIDYIPATDGGVLHLLTSSDNGSNFDTGASDYAWWRSFVSDAVPTQNDFGDDADDSIVAAAAAGTGTGESIGGWVRFANHGGAFYKSFDGLIVQRSSSAVTALREFHGQRLSTTAVDAIRFIPSSGNMASGKIVLRARVTA